MPKLKMGERREDGSRVGYCPTCGKPGVIRVEIMATTAPGEIGRVVVTIQHASAHHFLNLRTPLVVREAAILCGVKPIAIYAAISRGSLEILTRQRGRPIEIGAEEFVEYFQQQDGRRKEKQEAGHAQE